MGDKEAKLVEGAELHLPDSVLEALGSSLFGADLLSARGVDRRWRSILTSLVRQAIVSPRHWTGNAQQRSEKLVKTFPGLETVQLILDANRNPKNLDPKVVEDALMPFAESPGLQNLQIM